MKTKKIIFSKIIYFLCLIICFLEKKKSFILFFIETFHFDISIITKLLIDFNLNDDISLNVNNWNFFDNEIFFFIIDFETTFFLKLFRTNFRIEILSYCFLSLFLNICMCLFIDESMKRDYVLITSLNFWTLNHFIINFSFLLVLKNRIFFIHSI